MTRLNSVSDTWKREVFSRETEEVFLLLLRITDVSLPQPIRVVTNTTTVGSLVHSSSAGGLFHSGYDATEDTVTFVSAHNMMTGFGPYHIRNSVEGGLPTGLSLETPYYVDVLDSTTVRLYPSPGLSGEAEWVDIEDQGTSGSVSTFVDAYLPFDFKCDLPPEGEEAQKGIRIEIDNVDQRIVDAVRTIVGKPRLEVAIILASDPDYAELGPFPMDLTDVEWTSQRVTGTIFPNDHTRRTPPHYYTPETFPDAFDS